MVLKLAKYTLFRAIPVNCMWEYHIPVTNAVRHTIQSVQVLRALGIFVIIGAHISIAVAYGDPTLMLSVPKWAVMLVANASDGMLDLFFVGSGFIMVYIAKDTFGQKGAAKKFALLRITRVVPVYWLYTSLAILMGWMIGNVAGFQEPSWAASLKSYFFIPYASDNMPALFGGVQEWVRPVLPAGWTLNFEMYFYALFMIALLWRLEAGLVLMTVYALAVSAATPFIPAEYVALRFWASGTILKFVTGCWIGYAYWRGVQYKGGPVGVLGVCLLAFLAHWCVYAAFLERPDAFLFHLLSSVTSGLMIACCVLTKFIETNNAPPQLVELGNATYSIYLSHIFIYVPVFGIMDAIFEMTLGQRIFVGFGAFGLALGLGMLSYWYIELPSIAIARAGLKKLKLL